MDAEFTRDALFTAGWFGLMTMVWLGWAQEDPPKAWRFWLGAGSVAGTLVAVGFGVAVATHWDAPTALEGRYGWFGLLVAVQVVAAGLGCLVLARRGRSRWMAWWVALVVAVHFLPLAWLLRFGLVGVVGVAEAAALLLLVPHLRGSTRPTSATVGPVMGCSLLIAALACGIPALSSR
jgi:hypothetical protein